MIVTRGLAKRFGTMVAVEELDLEIGAGEVFGLVGPDGAGKTTTLRMLAGLVHPSAGEMRVAGFDPVRQPEAVRDRIGYMAQRFGLYVDLTVEENLHFYAELFGVGKQDRDRRMVELLGITRMEPFRGRRAGQLSGGMKQKLALACALLHQPQVLLLDEPTNGVDPVSRRDFWVILNRMVGEGMTLLVTTCYLDEAERCHRVGLMHRGKLLACEPPEAGKLEEMFVERIRRAG